MRIFPNNVYIIYVRARHDTEVKNKAKKKKDLKGFLSFENFTITMPKNFIPKKLLKYGLIKNNTIWH